MRYAGLDQRPKHGQERLATLIIHAGDDQNQVPVIKLEAVKDAKQICQLILSRRARAIQRQQDVQMQQPQMAIPVVDQEEPRKRQPQEYQQQPDEGDHIAATNEFEHGF